MRSSLSCDVCRRNKVKCVNEGHPPCRKCEKAGNLECVLSRPEKPGARTPKRVRLAAGASRDDTPGGAVLGARETVPNSSGSVVTASISSSSQRNVRGHGHAPGQSHEAPSLGNITAHLAAIPNSIILKTLNIFSCKYPELAVLHPTVFMRDLVDPRSQKESQVLLAVALAVTRDQLRDHEDRILLTRDVYASYAKEHLSEFILQPPKVQVVQTLLIITLHEWGSRDFHRAWIYCGIAIRIMQALHSARVAPYPLDIPSPAPNDPLTLAVESRTYWACFIMDCTVNAGTYNPRMLPRTEMRKLRVGRPLSAVEFAFGPAAPPAAAEPSVSGPLDITQSFEIMVGGFDVWAQVMAFVFNDGRRAEGMCRAENCPWVEGTVWAELRRSLEEWRAGQHRRLLYPENSAAVHISLGYGESFTYLNLLYYVSTLMLHREYFPLLPEQDQIPQGPVDPCLQAEAPAGWWDESARELFGAAEKIARLLHETAECGGLLMTPFVGFCAFTACCMNLYVSFFPRMNLGRSPDAAKLMNWTLDYLKEFQSVWKLGSGWIKTIQNTSLLYERAAANRSRYRGKSRSDFNHLHQSLHEFRNVDRSDQHLQEINSAETPMEPLPTPTDPPTTSTTAGGEQPPADASALLGQMLAEVSSGTDEQVVWPNWWSMLEDVDMTGSFGGVMNA
ncbi:hypothetical protein BN1723_004903 [Verticillium longisporum]|uniref:Zn(2)-C6 fungal-type domain-containing protein n=1 Tax=Verticillium longisporum TaxID=100787 RepID=A0A0G4N2R9_VERLO|nr:putative transcriptional regulatory protein PB1A11.04c like [Verticillium longisporum]CRK40659.1 hypothetical protein BN1723_004903 [Verticillium longisporum]